MFRALRAILAQHRRLSDVETTSETQRHDVLRLEQTLRELQSDVEWLAGEVRTLRGRVTGGLRKKEPPAEDNGAPPPGDMNAAIKAGVFFRRR